VRPEGRFLLRTGADTTMHKTMTAIASALTILVCASSWLSCGSGGLLFEPDTALPHLPAGFTTLIDEPWNEVAPPNWSLASFGQNKVSLAQDASAPRSPSSVLQFRYPAGDPDVGGEGAGARSYDTADYSQYYIAFWYKHSSNWVYHDSCYNKLLYFANNSSSGDNEGIVHDCNGELAVTLQNDISERYESNFGGGYTMALGPVALHRDPDDREHQRAVERAAGVVGGRRPAGTVPHPAVQVLRRRDVQRH
jgi:hypothetical protein